jgi:hypothetical protein
VSNIASKNYRDDDVDLIARRIEAYKLGDAKKQRQKLVQLWRQAHPEATKEASRHLHPLIPADERLYKNGSPDDPDEVWHNDIYSVSVRRSKDTVFGSDQPMVKLGISSLDGTARHDWRDMQAIKNQLVGPEVEAFELYPAESRLMDPSNQFILWCFPGIRRIRCGGNDPRRVLPASEALAPQRALPEETE